MKKRIILLLICLLTLAVSLCLFTACDEPETPDNGGGTTEGGSSGGGTTEDGNGGTTPETPEISFKTLTVDGTNVTGTVSNATTEFSFLNEVETKGGAKFVVALDANGMQTVVTKKITLTPGDNTVYVIETVDGEATNVYKVVIRRKPIYTVSFNTAGGTSVETQYIEESYLATEPTTTRAGYTFASWSYNFSTPITDNIEITANWNVNGNTPYKVEYYRQNVDRNGYDLISSETINTNGQTDTTAYAPEKTFDHFTINKSMGKLSGNIDGNGTLVLKVYYTRNTYSISAAVNNSNGGSVTGSGTYAYEKRVTLTATTKPGYTFLGWFEGETKVCSELTYSFNADRAVTYTAKWNANENTPYKVEYYLENVNKNGYDLISSETINTNGQTDTTAYAPEKTFDHFTINKSMGKLSGNIDGEGTLVLKVYYTRNTYKLSNANTSYGTISSSGTYVYGGSTQPFEVTVTAVNIGYNFIGWYSGETKLSSETTYTFTVDKNVEARFEVKSEMSPFNFTSTATTCQITGIKDKTVTEIIVPDYVTSISHGAFSGCSKLEKITIPFVGGSRKTSSDTYQYPFGYIFGTSSYTGGTATEQYYYGSSTSNTTYDYYYIPSTLKSVTVTGGNILRGAFENCSSLTSVTIPNSVTTIGDWAFAYCDSLTSVEIPNSVTSIGSRAFFNCDSLTSVEIPNSVTSIGYRAFYYCDSLTSVVIGNSVTSIGNYAFFFCDSLTSIKYRGTQTQWNAISKGSRWDEYYDYDYGTYIKPNYTVTYNYTGE